MRSLNSIIAGVALGYLALLPVQASVDPTKPAIIISSDAESSTEEQGSLALQSIFKRRSGYSAIISGKSYREGDTLGEYTVSKINAKDVVITDGRQQKILRMYTYEIKE